MKKFIFISALIELLAGAILFFMPELVPDLVEGTSSHMAMARMYGAAAIGLGIFAFQVWRDSDNEYLVRIFLSVFLIFNLCAFIGIFSSFLAGIFTNPGGAMLHLILGIFSAYYFIKINLTNFSKIRKILAGAGIAIGTLAVLLFLLPNILQQAGLHPHYTQSKEYNLTGKKALIITTSHDVLNAPGETTGKPTGVFASEMTIPYYEFQDAGMKVDVASIKGGTIPVDPQSFLFMIKSDADKRYLKDEDFQNKVENSLKIDDVNFTQYDAVWLAGGWGAAYDLGQSEVLGEKISEAYYAQTPTIGSVCHGALGLIQAKDTTGNYLITGRTMTGVTDKQLKELGITLTPLHPETELRKLGVNYKFNSGNQDIFHTITVVDEEKRFVTGQNQNSGHETAQKLMAIILEKSSKEILD
jgi:putative intracellular protease/amidase